MPTLPRPQCSHYGCKAPSKPGSALCIDHSPTPRVNLHKRAGDALYKSAVWHRIRVRQLSVAPLCAACKLAGRITQGEHVDHVAPWKSLGDWAFTIGPFQTLCGPCHSVKTGLEHRGVFRHYTTTGPVDYGPDRLPAELIR